MVNAENTPLPRNSKSETSKKEETLTQAKDRAQVTATTAMSVLNIAMLKDIVDRGPDDNPFYVYLLTFMILSLAFQIVAGVLSLFVAGLRSYYTKYKGDMCEDLTNHMCCLQVKRGKDGEEEGRYLCGCCRYETANEGHTGYEYKVLDGYDTWCEEMMEKELKASEVDVMLPELERLVKQANDQVKNLEEQKKTGILTDEEFKKKYNDVDSTIWDAGVKRTDLEKMRIDLEICRSRGNLIHIRADDIRQDHIFKSITFWQGSINYILYFVFVFNAFIAGLGVVNGKGPGSADQPTTTLPPSL